MKFATTSFGRSRLHADSTLHRHRHAEGYVAVVLSGTYIEAGDEGRRRVQPGDVLVHQPFDGHLDLIGSVGASVLNLPLPTGRVLPPAFRVVDPDAVARAAETDVRAAQHLLEAASGAPALFADWPDLLAAELRANPHLCLSRWARHAGLAPATLSRGFRAAFAVPPARYRLEARARRALHAIAQGNQPFADLALTNGFADQAHLSRAITGLTGRPPSAWRTRSNPFKTMSRPAA